MRGISGRDGFRAGMELVQDVEQGYGMGGYVEVHPRKKRLMKSQKK